MNTETLIVERKEPVCTLIINRPEKKNALTPELLVKIYQTLKDLSKEDAIRAVILRGAGDEAFSSGMDLSVPLDAVPPEIQETLKTKNLLALTLDAIKDFPYPVIAMLNGYALGGGCHLTLCCDMRIGADDIRMGMPPADLGIVYHPDGLRDFISVLGLGRTKEVFLRAHRYKAREAKEIGLLDYVVARSELETFTSQVAGELASKAPLSLKGHKRIFKLFSDSLSLSPEAQLEAEALVEAAVKSDDLKEAQRAFKEKRKPVFKGK
jgi:enoyl-CoA hydratase